jgi:hypothetical protein
VQVSAFWAALIRRWYLVIAAVLCTVAATAFMVNRIGPTYEAQGTVLLFPPTTTVQQGSTTETLGNPYLMLGGLTQARDVVIRTITSKSAREQIAKTHPGVKYTATPDFTTGGPLILVTVSAKTSEQTVDALESVLDTVPQSLEKLQNDLNLEDNALITSRQLTADERPDVVRKGQIRAGILVAALTLAVALLLIGLYDGLIGSRRSGEQSGGRRARREQASAEDQAPGAPVTQLRRRKPPEGQGESATGSTP